MTWHIWPAISCASTSLLQSPSVFAFLTQRPYLQFALALAQAAAPFGAGVAYDVLRSYEPILWGLAAISAFAVVAVLPAKREASDQLQSEP